MCEWYGGLKHICIGCQSVAQCRPGAPLQGDGTARKRERFDRRRCRSDMLDNAGHIEGLVLINLVKVFGLSDRLWL